jgi:hypothetical protein
MPINNFLEKHKNKSVKKSPKKLDSGEESCIMRVSVVEG